MKLIGILRDGQKDELVGQPQNVDGIISIKLIEATENEAAHAEVWFKESKLPWLIYAADRLEIFTE